MTYLNKYINFSLLLAAMVFTGGGLIPLAEAGTPPVPFVLSIPIETGSDDAEENTSSGFMSLTSSDLELTRDGTKTQKIGLRFPLDIPAGATIVSAYVQFTVDETSSELTNLTVHGEAIANALTFTSAGFDISSRTLTAASEAWNALEVWDNVGAAGLDQQTPDLSAIVQEVIDLGSWAEGNYVAFIISGSGKRVAESFTGTAPAVLHVEYTIELPGNLAPDAVDDDLGATPAYTTGQDQVLTVLNGLDDIVERNDNVGFPVAAVTSFGPFNGGETDAGFSGVTAEGGSVIVDANGSFIYTPPEGHLGADSFVYTLTNEVSSDTAIVFIDVQQVQAVTTIWVPVLTGSDDAEERMATGSVSLTSSDLEMVRDGILEQIVGVRFQNVVIPQGATIVNAYIQYTSDEVGTEDTNLVIHGQNSVNPATFTTTNSDLSNRPLTASQVFWMPPSWTTNEQSSAIQATPDLKAIAQELVDQAGWVSGNSMVFITSGEGKRVAESFNGTAAPMLHVTYSTGPTEPDPDRAPDAVDEGTNIAAAYVTDLDTELVVPSGVDDVLENDDLGDPTAVISGFDPVSAGLGTVDLNLDGSFTYTPALGFIGVDSFSYTLTNPAGSDTATVYISVEEVLPVGAIWASVITSSDDAEENLSNGGVQLTSSDLELIRDGAENQLVGVRFQGINIPQGAVITSAYVQFQADENSSETTNLIIRGESNPNAPTFTTATNNISGRVPTQASVLWTDLPVWNAVGVAGVDQQTPDLTTIVQEIVNLGGWSSGSPIVFMIEGTGRRTAESFNGTAAPELHVTFSTGPVLDRAPDAVDEGTNIAAAYVTDLNTPLIVPNGVDDVLVNDDLGNPTAVISVFDPVSTGLGTVDLNLDGSFTYTPALGFIGVDSFSYTLTNPAGSDTAIVYIRVEDVLPVGTILASVITSSDDAEENLSNGGVQLTSSDLELIRDGVENQLVGIRFQGINIPQGAVITSAYVQFQVDEIGSETTNILIYGESNANAPTFTTATNNISGRVPTLASVLWTDLPEWNTLGVAGVDQQTPDLTTIVQEIVNLGGWSSGSPIVFMIEGTGKRTAESFNGTAGPELHVTFSTEPIVSSPPVAVDDFFTTSMNVPVAGNLLTNDDLGFPSATIFSFVNSVQGGNAALFTDGSFTYTPPLDFLGPDTFQYTISNGELPNSSATVTVDIQNVGNEITLSIPVITGTDDAEEDVSDGDVFTTSSDLELVLDRAKTQIVGVRFQNVDVPLGVVIEEAYIQYTVDEDTLEQTDLVVVGELNPNPLTFNSALVGNISLRPTTAATVLWSSVPAWPSRGAAGPDQRTPDLSEIVQELIGQLGWVPGNSMVFITSGLGNRVAESFSGTAAPELHLVYSTIPAENLPPVANNVSIIDDNGGDLVVGDTLTGAYTYSDPEDNEELNSEFVWYRSGVAIPGATATTYTTVPADAGETISFEVTPHAIGGATTGATVSSSNTPFVYFELGGMGPAGGIIFFIDGGGSIGLGGMEVSPDMLDPAPWGCHQFVPIGEGVIGVKIGVEAQATGTGEQSTADIVAGCNQDGIAAKLAAQHNLNGFNWVLPSAQEGVLLQATGYAGAGTQNFWTASEKSGSSAYFVQKTTGLIVKRSKNTEYYVHPIRTFGSLVGNVAPEAQNVVIEDVLFDIGEILVGFYDYFDTEGDLEGSTLLQWFRNEIAIVGEIFDVYVADDPLDIGAQLTFGVTAVAQTGSPVGETIVSDIFSPFNTPPTATMVEISVNGIVLLPGGEVNEGQLMQGNYIYDDGELDFEGVSTYQWYRNTATPIPGATTEFYTPCDLDMCQDGDVYHFEVTPIAETGDPIGDPKSSAAVTYTVLGPP